MSIDKWYREWERERLGENRVRIKRKEVEIESMKGEGFKLLGIDSVSQFGKSL